MNGKLLYHGALNSTATTTVFTAAWPTTITDILLANTTASAATIALFHNGSAAANTILPATSIPAGGHGAFRGEIHLETGDTLRLDQGTAAAITVSVYGEVHTA